MLVCLWMLLYVLCSLFCMYNISKSNIVDYIQKTSMWKLNQSTFSIVIDPFSPQCFSTNVTVSNLLYTDLIKHLPDVLQFIQNKWHLQHLNKKATSHQWLLCIHLWICHVNAFITTNAHVLSLSVLTSIFIWGKPKLLFVVISYNSKIMLTVSCY